MKKEYMTPTITVTGFDVNDVICTSGVEDGQWGQLVPGDKGDGKVVDW